MGVEGFGGRRRVLGLIGFRSYTTYVNLYAGFGRAVEADDKL